VFKIHTRSGKNQTLVYGNDIHACQNLTQRLECVWKSHSACRNHTRMCQKLTLRVEITLLLVVITLLCKNHTRVYNNDIFTCRNITLRAEITLVRVVITLVRVKITLMFVDFFFDNSRLNAILPFYFPLKSITQKSVASKKKSTSIIMIQQKFLFSNDMANR
jgi:hypothetical protein